MPPETQLPQRRPLECLGDYASAVLVASLPKRLAISAAVLGTATMILAAAPAGENGLVCAVYSLAVPASAMLGGVAPGALSAVAAALLAHLLFSANSDIGLALLLAAWLVFCAVIESLRRTRLSRDNLQSAADLASEALFMTDADGRVQWMNRAAAVMFGEATAGARLESLLGAVDIDAPRTGRAAKTIARRADGETLPAEVTLVAARPPCGAIGMVRDLRGQQSFERDLEARRRLHINELGHKAERLAHEVNQPLAAIVTYLRVARRLIEKDPAASDSEILQIVDKSAEQALRAGRIISSLRNLFHLRPAEKALLSLHEQIDKAITALRREGAPDNPALSVKRGATKDVIMADPTQLGQALDIVLRMVADVTRLSPGRQLAVETANPDRNTIRVDIIDRSGGVAESCAQELLKAFTKRRSGGGMGLSAAHSIIEEIDGWIWAAPEAGGASLLSFTLPLQDSDIAS